MQLEERLNVERKRAYKHKAIVSDIPKDPNLNYIGLPSIDEYSKKVENLGGKALMPKTKVEGSGFFAVCSDTENNSFALWEITQQK